MQPTPATFCNVMLDQLMLVEIVQHRQWNICILRYFSR